MINNKTYTTNTMKGVKKLHTVTIVADKQAEDLVLVLNSHLKTLSSDKNIIKEEIDKNLNTLKYIINPGAFESCDNSSFVKMFNKRISLGIYDYLNTFVEPYIIKEFINQEYNYFNIDERKEIQLRSQNETIKPRLDKERQLEIKNGVVSELENYLETNNEINIKGFTIFRLKEYIESVKSIVDEAVEDFLMDKEYNEFIKLLRYFVDIQDSKVETVHIYMKEENDYSIFDDYGKEMNNEYLKLIATEMRENDLSYDDLLISSLITIAPNNIVIHKTGNCSFDYIIGTITRIFNNKVELCNGCDWCIIKSNVNKD